MTVSDSARTDGPRGKQDLHVHTTMSDGQLALDDVVAIGVERGVEIGIADHVSARSPDLFVSTPARLEAYLEALSHASVYRSAELCWRDSFSASTPRGYADRFDYLIGSNHGFDLPDGSPISPWTRALPPAWESRPEEVMDLIVWNLCQLVSTMPIQIVAHSTLLPPALLALEPDVQAWWTAEREARFIDAATRAGVAIEISNRYRVPHRRFLESARQAGARFTLGSDGHQRDQVGRLEWAVEAAKEAGIGEKHLFVPERKLGGR